MRGRMPPDGRRYGLRKVKMERASPWTPSHYFSLALLGTIFHKRSCHTRKHRKCKSPRRNRGMNRRWKQVRLSIRTRPSSSTTFRSIPWMFLLSLPCCTHSFRICRLRKCRIHHCSRGTRNRRSRSWPHSLYPARWRSSMLCQWPRPNPC